MHIIGQEHYFTFQWTETLILPTSHCKQLNQASYGKASLSSLVHIQFLNTTTEALPTFKLSTLHYFAPARSSQPYEEATLAFALHERRLKGSFDEPNG